MLPTTLNLRCWCNPVQPEHLKPQEQTIKHKRNKNNKHALNSSKYVKHSKNYVNNKKTASPGSTRESSREALLLLFFGPPPRAPLLLAPTASTKRRSNGPPPLPVPKQECPLPPTRASRESSCETLPLLCAVAHLIVVVVHSSR